MVHFVATCGGRPQSFGGTMTVTDSKITKQLSNISRSLRDLERGFRSLAPLLAALNGSPPRTAASRPPLKLTARRLSELKLQGSYLGYMRQLKTRQKAQVRALREKRGVEAAIKLARRLAGSRS